MPRVHYDVALAAFRLLVAVVTPAFAGIRRLGALRIDKATCALRV
ncbi:MAG: hypothetical protein ABL933_17235 [Methyloglobulus sp.]